MLLPGATALAKTPLNADSFDSSYVKSAAKTSGKGAGNGNGKGDGNDLYKNGLLNTGATSERAMRQMVGSAKEYLVKHADSNADSNNSAAGVDNQEAAAGDSSVGVKDSGERSDAGSETGDGASYEASNDASSETGSEAATDSATETATNGEQDNSDVAKPESKAVKKEQSAEVKPAETPASKTEPAKSEPADTDPADTDPAKTEVVNPTPAAKTADASNPEPANSEPSAKTSSETKTNSSAKTEADQKSAQPANTENAKPEIAQNAQPVAKSGKEKTEPATENADSENAKPAAEQPAAEQSASTASTQTAAKSENDSTTPKVRNRRDVNQSAKDSNKGSSVTAEGADAGASSTDRSGEGANGSNNNSNANSQVIKPNEKNQTAESQNEANNQVQTDKKPEVTYNLQIRYTIGGAPNKQLVQPYELTIDEAKLNELNKSENYVYVKLPKSAGYNPAVYHSGNYQYYIEKSKGKYVIDDGMHADAPRYLRIDKNLIKEYAIKQRQVVGGNNSDQTSQNPSSSQAPAKDGIQYYGELNINYAPKTAKYYIRHMLQDADNRNTFNEDKNVPGVKTITVGNEKIYVTEVTGTVGSNVSAVSVYVPGYEPEHNLISSPLSDSEDEKDKLVLNLRYYRKAYDVTYDSAGGTDVTAQKVYYDQKIITGTDPTKRGYTFKGWQIVDPASGDSAAGTTSESSSTGSTSTKTVDFDKFKMPDHDVKLRAIWEENKTTSYSVSVWVQKADLVDKEHPDSRANYDFVGLVERKNVKTGSSVDLNSMNDAGVANDPNKLSGTNKDNPILDSELGLTKEELQGTDSDHETGLIAKFNWMNDTHVTSLDGYDTENPGAESNYLRDSNGNYVTGPIDTNNRDLDNRVYKDLFTRYFYVNKKLTKRYTKDPNNTSTKLSANDLDNTFDLVYDRKEYELIFAKPAGVDGGNNAAIKRKDENGKTTIYCYAGGGDCSDKYDGVNEGDHGAEINHNGYRVKVRYGQSLTDIWPDVDELDFNNGEGSLGWRIGFARGVKYRDTPPYRFTKKEFADPRWRAVFEKNQKDKVAPSISEDPSNPNTQKYELKDNQRLLTADTDDKSNPIQVIIRKQSIASAKKHKEGDKISADDYELSTDSYSKDDTPSNEYDYPAPSIAGFNPADGYDTARVGEALSSDNFEDKLEEWYNESNAHVDWDYLSDDAKERFAEKYHIDLDDTKLEELYNESNAHVDWEDLSDEGKKDFAKKYHLAFRKYRGVPVDEQEDYTGDDALEYDDNKPLEFRYDRQKYAVQFYNADGNAIKDGSDAATEELPYEYSLTKRGKKDLTGEDKDLYGNDTSYDASVVKDDLGNTSKQLDGKYTFTLNGKTYSIVRPADLPKDYVFKGWAVDQTGRHLINGEINDNSEGAEGASKAGSKDKGEVKDYTMPVNGIKLYAAWGKPTDIKHTVTLDYDMQQLDDQGNVITDSNVTEQFTVEHRKKVNEQKLKVPTRKGYYFYGWELAKKGDEELNVHTPYAFSNQVVEDITLKAVWIEDTRHNGTFNHIFLKPGVTIADYKNATDAASKAAMVDHVSTQTVSGLREHLRYNAEAVYSDETHFPDKHFTSFEASSDASKNTGEFIYQTYNTRKYKVKYIDQNGNDLLPESEVSSVNRKYDVAFYKPIEGFKPRELQHTITYVTDDDGKQKAKDIRTFIFTYDDVRVLKRKDESQARPTNYTRYVFKVAAGQSTMGSIVGYDSRPAGEGGLVYDVIGGTKAYQMPLPQDPVAKQGYEFAGWTVKKTVKDAHGVDKEVDGINRLPVLSETQTDPKVVYTANFKLIAPKPAQEIIVTPGTTSLTDATKNKLISDLVQNSSEFPDGSEFSYADGEKFDNTPGLHKIKVQVKMGNQIKTTDVFYRVLPNVVYGSEWEKFKTSDYAQNQASSYVPLKFTTVDEQGEIVGKEDSVKDGDGTGLNAKHALTVYVYKGQKVKIALPKAFGKDHNEQKYNYVFKGWKSTDGSLVNFTDGMVFDLATDKPYAEMTLNNQTTYQAVYKKIDYVSGKSDSGEVPKDSVVAIFKPAPGRLWSDGTSGPKVFYVKKNSNVSDIKINYDGSEKSILSILSGMLTGADGWSQSNMNPIDKNNVKDRVEYSKEVTDWIMGGHAFQEFVAKQKPLAKPKGLDHALLAVQDVKSSLHKAEEYISNIEELRDAAKNPNIESVNVEFANGSGPTAESAATYTVPLKVTIKYKDVRDPQPYDVVGVLQVLPKLVPQNSDLLGGGTPGSGHGTTPGDTTNPVVKMITDTTAANSPYAKVTFENAADDTSGTSSVQQGSLTGNKVFYVVKNSNGVTAPQAVGKDYDADGYHYVFKGWRKVNPSAANNAVHTRTRRSLPDYSAIPLTTLFVNQPTSATSIDATNTNNDLLTYEQILKKPYSEDTTYQAVYEKMENVIDASQQDKIPDGYVATIFLPEIGHRWSNGEYKPKLLYIRHGKDIKDNIKFAQKVADDTGKLLSGFVKWRMYDAKGHESNVNWKHAWDIATPRIFVAEQSGISDIKIPETVIGVGDAIPNLNKLVHNTDPNVNVSINRVDGQGEKPKDADNPQGAKDYNTYVYQPGTATVTVDVTRPTDEVDPKTKKRKTNTTQIQVRLHVLPNVIADNDLPAEGTAEAKFVQKNYAKVTYVAGDGGEMKSPVFTYWVRKGAKDLHMPVPDVLANKGYVFKDWTSITTETPAVPADKRKATDEEREALARMAIMSGKTFVANVIRRSHASTLAALQHLLEEAQKVKNDPIATDAEREKIAQFAETDNKPWVANLIRNSRHSTVEALNNLLKIAKVDGEREILALMAEHENKPWVASIIRKSHNSKTESLKLLLQNAGVDPDKPHDYTVDMSGIIDEQREVLAELADDANKPFVAKTIRSSKKSSLEDLKQLLRNAGVNPEISLPEPQPTRETTITANFEEMKPMRFEFRSSAISGIPATFTLANLTENSSGDTTVSVDGVNSLINALTTNSLGSNGLLPSCTGTTCKISGTPKIVDGKPKVEVKFTTVDQYGRRAEIVVYIDVVDSAKPEPTPVPVPTPTPEPDYSTVPSDYVVPAYEPAPVPAPVPVVPLQDKQKTGVKGDLLPQTGVDASQSALIASLLASVGFAGFAAKHRRKREDGKNN